MAENHDTVKREFLEFSRVLDSAKPVYEIGSTVGCYKLVSMLGEGGFGMVYLAEQQHPAKRLVALKVVKPCQDSKPFQESS
jgi:serine/threonine protein kinase